MLCMNFNNCCRRRSCSLSSLSSSSTLFLLYVWWTRLLHRYLYKRRHSVHDSFSFTSLTFRFFFLLLLLSIHSHWNGGPTFYFRISFCLISNGVYFLFLKFYTIPDWENVCMSFDFHHNIETKQSTQHFIIHLKAMNTGVFWLYVYIKWFSFRQHIKCFRNLPSSSSFSFSLFAFSHIFIQSISVHCNVIHRTLQHEHRIVIKE